MLTLWNHHLVKYLLFLIMSGVLLRYIKSQGEGKESEKGIITYIVRNNNRVLPKFSISENPTYVFQEIDQNFDPYLIENGIHTQFNTKKGDPAYLIFDFGDIIRVKPTMYSISINNGSTPPFEWSVLGKNDNDWNLLSHPTTDSLFCPGMQTCTDSVIKKYDIYSNNTEFYRYIKFNIIDSRISGANYFRIRKFEIYGFIYDNNFCNTIKHSIFKTLPFVLFIFILK